MGNHFKESSDLDNSLKQLEHDMMWNQERKAKLLKRILLNIDKLDDKPKPFSGFKYATSIGIFIVLLLFGYGLFLSQMNHTSEESPMDPQHEQIPNNPVTGDVDDEEDINENQRTEKANRYITTEEKLLNDMDLRLPDYIPNQTDADPHYIKHDHPNGTKLAEIKYIDSGNLFLGFSQSELDESKEATIKKVKNEMYKNEELEEMELAGHPAFLRLEGDTSYYSSLHIITEEYFISLNTHGFDKEEIMKIAHSIDLAGL